MNWSNLKVTITGGAGFVGRVLCEKLRERGCCRIDVPRRGQYDLTTESAVERMYQDFEPDVVIHLAAEVGGIGANRSQPGRFFFANMSMGMHLVEQARLHAVKKFIHTGSVCAYPKHTPVPFREEALWNGYPEETNAPYGVAKKAILVMLEAYKQQYGLNSSVVLPVNLYGPADNFDLNTSHVIPALIRKCIEARNRGDSSMVCWGTGAASREFLYVEDAAEGILRAAETMEEPIPINLGTGKEISIKILVEFIAKICRFEGRIEWDTTKPDGQPRRCLDVQRAAKLLNWHAKMDIETGLRQTIEWFEANQNSLREVQYE